MSCFLYVNDDDAVKKINIDDLYEKKQQRDLKQVSIFNKILNRIQHRIQMTGRTKRNEKHVWFTVPEYIFGEPIYDKGDCIAYVVTKLEENGFFIRYMHPNTLFISWENWVPSYVRNEIKKKRGIVLDDRGNIIDTKREDADENPDSKMFNDRGGAGGDTGAGGKDKKQYTPIGSYKPTGNLVYKQEIFDKLEKKIVFKDA
jgi:hypothetical protein